MKAGNLRGAEVRLRGIQAVSNKEAVLNEDPIQRQ